MSWVFVPGRKIALKPSSSSAFVSSSGMMPAAEEEHVVQAALLHFLDDTREELEVRAGEDAQTDDVDVFLEGRFRDHLRSLADAGVDDLAAAVAQCAGDDLGATVVAIEARLGDEDTDLGAVGAVIGSFCMRAKWSAQTAGSPAIAG